MNDTFSLSQAEQEVTQTDIKTSLLKTLGPGLITGAADDDPSGIATYSQVGAQFGFSMLWTALFSYPLMAAIQEICGRMGRVTGKGIAANMRVLYPAHLLYGVIALLLIANTLNIAADLSAMGAALNLLIGGPSLLYVILFALVCLLLEVLVPYSKYVNILKWLTLTLFVYVGTVFAVHVNWRDALYHTVIPTFSLGQGFLTAFIAVLGTTISPYLFFWQSSQEVEEIKLRNHRSLVETPAQNKIQFKRITIDTLVGTGFSNLITFFIIFTAAATLHSAGVLDIQSADQAASALKPIAGELAFLFFAAGIIGTGMLAVPVLAGSAAYGVCDLLGKTSGLEKKPREARTFYGVIAVSVIAGLLLNFFGIDPIRSLFWSAVINGIIAGPLMIIIMFMSTDTRIMHSFVIPRRLKILGWAATGVMTLATLAFFGQLIVRGNA